MWPEHKPSAVIWDLDGTLVDSAPDLAYSLNQLLQQYGRSQLTLDVVRSMIGGGAPRLVERGFRATGVQPRARDFSVVVEQFLTIYRQHATIKTCPRPGVIDALEAFANAGIAQAVCTNKPADISRTILAELGVIDFFRTIAGGDTTSHKKPAPDSLNYCLGQLAAKSCQALLIGDSAADVGAARAAGVPVILVRGGYSRDPVEKLNADAIAPSIFALQQMVLTPQKAGPAA